MSLTKTHYETSKGRTDAEKLASGLMLGVSTDTLLQLIKSNGGAPLLVNVMVRAPSVVYEVVIELSRQDSDDSWKATIGATKEFASGATAAAVVGAVLKQGLVAAGAIAVGAPLGTGLTIALGVATTVLMVVDEKQGLHFAQTIQRIGELWFNGDLGIRDYLQETAIKFLDHLDGIFGNGNGNNASDYISDPSLLFTLPYNTPIIIDLNDNGLDLVNCSKGVNFDIDADGFAEKSGWVKPNDAFLVHDLNGNGVIDSQIEMFGTDKTSTAAAKLKALDANKDGFVDAKDDGFATLRLWRDLNQDGVSQTSELFTLESQEVAKLATAITDTNTSSAGNILDWKSIWYKVDGKVGGDFHDVLFQTSNVDSWYVGPDATKRPSFDLDTLLLPQSRGYGIVKSMHLAASENATVLAMLNAVDSLALNGLAQANQKVADLLFSWAGVSAISPESGGKFFNQQLIAFMERLFDHDFKVAPNTNGAGLDYPAEATSTNELSNEWGLVWQELKTRLLVQGPLHEIFENAYYSFGEDKVVFGELLSNILGRAKMLEPASGTDAYWQEIGMALVVHADQFGGNVVTIKTAVNTAAGKTIPIYENWLKGQSGDESFKGSKFSDLIELGYGNDIVAAGEGDDAVLGGVGSDKVSGDTGHDALTGGLGNDLLKGGIGNDTYLFAKKDGADTILDGGSFSTNTDTLAIAGYTMAQTVFTRVGNSSDLRITFVGSTTDKILVDDGLENGNDTLEMVTVGGVSKAVATLRTEVIARQTTAGSDRIEGWSWLANKITGGLGKDSITGGDLKDTLKGDAGNDTLLGMAGSDSLMGGLDADSLKGGAGNDTYLYAKKDGADTIQDAGTAAGSVDRLLISGYTLKQAIFARVGNSADLMITFAGSKTDKILVDDGLENGNDTLEIVTVGKTSKSVAALRTEVLASQATAGNDTIVGFDDCINVINGKGGADKLMGGNLVDILSGGAGNDTLDGGYGADKLIGGVGADTFYFTTSGTGTGLSADSIADFKRVEDDKIDLHGFRVDAGSFVGASALSKTINSFGYVFGKDAAGKKITTVSVDTNHDGRSDENIILHGAYIALKASDFIFV